MLCKKTIKLIKNYLAQNNFQSGAPFSGLVFGNAFSNEEYFIGAGEGRRGKKINEEMYWRWASMTKLVGLITLGAALEDGIIESLEDPISKYIPQFSAINQYVSGATATGGVDKYGTPNYEMVLTPVPGLGDQITIRHLLESRSGLGYLFWGLGSSRQIFVDGFEGVPAGQRYIAYLQYLESQIDIGQGNVDPLTSYYFNIETDITQAILARTQYPLLAIPGTAPSIYGVDWDVLGGVISAALQLKGIHKTAAQYTKSRIFCPLGMNDSWLGLQSLSAPKDICKRLTQGAFVRANNIDGQAGPNVQFNVIYGSFDPQAQGDGFVRQENDVAFGKRNPNSYLAGGYSAYGFGTLTDFAKLMILLIQKGKYNCKQILTSQTVEWILSPKLPLGDPITSSGQDTFNLLINPVPPFLPSYRQWAGGISKVSESATNVPFPLGPNTYTWGGYYGTTFYFDTESGYYLVSGCQVSLASWYAPGKVPPYQPDALYLFRTLVSADNDKEQKCHKKHQCKESYKESCKESHKESCKESYKESCKESYKESCKGKYHH